MRKKDTYLLAVIAFTVLFIHMICKGQDGILDLKNWPNIISTIALSFWVAWYALDRLLWKIPLINWFWCENIPDISGTWKGDITWGTEGEPHHKTVYMSVKQNFSTISYRLYTDESFSKTICSSITKENDGEFILYANYHNEPKAILNSRSKMHYGAVRLCISRGDRGTKLIGKYYNDRSSAGDMSFSERAEGNGTDYESCKDLFL